MFVVAMFALVAGAWLLDSAVQNRNPIGSLVETIRDPANARTTRENASGTGFVVDRPTVSTKTTTTGPGVGSANAAENTTSTGRAAGAIAFARKAIGAGYSQTARYGPASYDCSGLMFKAYESIGVKIGTWTGAQILNGTPVKRENIQPGDLVFPHAGHVGIATTAGWPCMFVDAPTWGKKVSERKCWAFFAARRIV